LRVGFDTSTTAELIRHACEATAMSYEDQTWEQWAIRPWLMEQETQHEAFLSSLPKVNAFVAQFVLSRISLVDLLNSPLDRLHSEMSTIPIKILEHIHKYSRHNEQDIPVQLPSRKRNFPGVVRETPRPLLNRAPYLSGEKWMRPSEDDLEDEEVNLSKRRKYPTRRIYDSPPPPMRQSRSIMPPTIRQSRAISPPTILPSRPVDVDLLDDDDEVFPPRHAKRASPLPDLFPPKRKYIGKEVEVNYSESPQNIYSPSPKPIQKSITDFSKQRRVPQEYEEDDDLSARKKRFSLDESPIREQFFQRKKHRPLQVAVEEHVLRPEDLDQYRYRPSESTAKRVTAFSLKPGSAKTKSPFPGKKTSTPGGGGRSRTAIGESPISLNRFRLNSLSPSKKKVKSAPSTMNLKNDGYAIRRLPALEDLYPARKHTAHPEGDNEDGDRSMSPTFKEKRRLSFEPGQSRLGWSSQQRKHFLEE